MKNNGDIYYCEKWRFVNDYESIATCMKWYKVAAPQGAAAATLQGNALLIKNSSLFLRSDCK